MSRAMPFVANSVAAEMSASAEVKSRVEVVVLDILRRLGQATHDEICESYHQRAADYPGIPKVTDQRIRSATARLNQKALVTASIFPGKSRLGGTATNWVLTLPGGPA